MWLTATRLLRYSWNLNAFGHNCYSFAGKIGALGLKLHIMATNETSAPREASPFRPQISVLIYSSICIYVSYDRYLYIIINVLRKPQNKDGSVNEQGYRDK